METLVLEAEKRLKKAATGHDSLLEDLGALVSAFKQVRFELDTSGTGTVLIIYPKQKSADADRLEVELQQAKVQCSFVKDQLTDVMDEKELMYEVRFSHPYRSSGSSKTDCIFGLGLQQGARRHV